MHMKAQLPLRLLLFVLWDYRIAVRREPPNYFVIPNSMRSSKIPY